MDESIEEKPSIPEWAAGLPEVLHDAPYLKASETPEDFLSQLKNASQYMGQSVRLPKDGEDTAAFLTKIEKYLPAAEAVVVPDAYDAGDIELPERYFEEAKRLGLTEQQWDAVVEQYQSDQQAQQEQLQAHRQQVSDELRQIWDTDTDAHLKEVHNLLGNTQAPEQIVSMLENGTLDAATTTWLASLASLGEESSEAVKGGDSKGAESEIASIDAKLRSGEVSGLEYSQLLDRKVGLMKSLHGGIQRAAG